MSDGSTDDDKQFDPSQKKLDDARKKGEIPRSTDLNTAAAYAGFLVVGTAIGASSLRGLGDILATLIGRSDSLSTSVFAGGGGAFNGSLLLAIGGKIGLWFAIPALVVILTIIGQRGFVFATSKLELKLSRISPIAQAKNKFGRSGLFEFIKSFSKLLIYSTILFIYLSTQISQILATLYLTPALAVAALLKLTLGMLGLVFVVALCLGGIDYIWQHAEHTRKNRMSRKELTDENKDAEGDPAMKQQRRQKGVEIAMNQMLLDVPEADVIIVNPTHYAVALKWQRSKGSAPICVAKGVDAVAARIREVANENQVPIHSDPPTARALHATVEIGESIQPDHYRAVAIAIRFADKIRKKARK